MSANDSRGDELATAANHPQPIGEKLRLQRVEVLNKGLREMAGLLDIAPAHLTDIEKGRRTPSEALMLKMAEQYHLPLADLRSGFSRPDAIVSEVASQNPTTAAKVPEFLRTARNLSAEQWDRLIRQASRMAGDEQDQPGGRK
jgi:transcriptional regulator with XRE-family HTH domain